MKKENPDPARNLAIAMELHEAGLAVMRQKFLREAQGPNATEEAKAKFQSWVFRRDDPIPGDVSGPVRIRRLLP